MRWPREACEVAKIKGVWTLCRKAIVQNATVQNGRISEIENVPIVLSSPVT